ncbi:hypothetical protein F4825DRAFT_433801 [Nemania diffusa]|nr:hypothetical protein F4825DRAFT_433801 [Nemania diffusa]
MDAAAARRVGARLLGEVEEGSLEELLNSLRASFTPNPTHHQTPTIPIPSLSALITQHQRATQSIPPPLLSVSGRYLPFLYHLISTLIAAPHNHTLVLIDTEGKFDITRLVASAPSTPQTQASYPATVADLAHVHVYTPGRGPERVKAVLAAVDEYMLYGSHESRGRAWWGTVVIGGGGSGGGTVNAGWKGWLRVERESVGVGVGVGVGGGGFAGGISVEEALREREAKGRVVGRAGWTAGSRWGRYTWKGG